MQKETVEIRQLALIESFISLQVGASYTRGWLAIGKYWAEIQQLALMTKFCLPSCHTMARARHEQRCLSLWIERVVPRCLSLGDGLSINLLGK